MSVLNHSNHPKLWANNISCVTICIQLGVMWEDIRVKTITAGLSCSPSSLAVYPLDGCSQTLWSQQAQAFWPMELCGFGSKNIFSLTSGFHWYLSRLFEMNFCGSNLTSFRIILRYWRKAALGEWLKVFWGYLVVIPHDKTSYHMIYIKVIKVTLYIVYSIDIKVTMFLNVLKRTISLCSIWMFWSFVGLPSHSLLQGVG
jgi:hypothetical protein